MTQIQFIKERIHDTRAAVLQIDAAIREVCDVPSIRLVRRSLAGRLETLEEELRDVGGVRPRMRKGASEVSYDLAADTVFLLGEEPAEYH